MSDLKRICLKDITDEMKQKIEEFLVSIKLEYAFVESDADATITIDLPAEREISTKEFLHSGGKISCPVAFNVAKNLGISKGNTGKFLNVVDIKIFGCQLGCFK